MKPGIPQPVPLVAHHARRDDDLDLRVVVAEALDVLQGPIANHRVEDFVEAIQEQQHAVRLSQRRVQGLWRPLTREVLRRDTARVRGPARQTRASGRISQARSATAAAGWLRY